MERALLDAKFLFVALNPLFPTIQSNTTLKDFKGSSFWWKGSWWGLGGKIQRKFLLVALNPLLAFSLMFSNRPGFVCSASFLNSRRSYINDQWCDIYTQHKAPNLYHECECQVWWSYAEYGYNVCKIIPAEYDGHVAGVTKSELVCWLAYACQGRIALQKRVNDDFDGKEDQI